jgi:hypothetical protein
MNVAITEGVASIASNVAAAVDVAAAIFPAINLFGMKKKVLYITNVTNMDI